MKQYFHNDFLIELLVLPALVAFIIVLSDGINNNSGIISGIATMLLITLSVPQGESLFCIRSRVRHFYWYADCDLHQFCLEASRKGKQAEIKEDLVVLKERETELKNYAGRCSRRNLQAARTKINALSLLSFYVSRQLVRKAFLLFSFVGQENLIYLPAIDENR